MTSKEPSRPGQPRRANPKRAGRTTRHSAVPLRDTGTGRAVTRITADVPTSDSRLLNSIAARTGYNKVTTLVRAIRVLGMLEDAKRDGRRVLLESSDGQRSELLLP